MKLPTVCFLSATVFVLAGCSSTPTRVDHGPIKAKTFSFINTGTKPAASFADNRAEIHPRVQEAISKTLAANGLTKVSSGADLQVGYLIIISGGVSTTAIDDYFGYDMATADLQTKAHDAFVVGKKNRTPYPAGTLVIDLVDTKSYRLLRRNFVCRPMLKDLPMDERVARLQEAVDEALQGLRLAP